MSVAVEKARSILEGAFRKDASDIFIVGGHPLTYKINKEMVIAGEERLMPPDTEEILHGIYELAGNRKMERFLDCGDDDFSFSLTGAARYRVSAYRQRGSMAAVIRVIAFELPQPYAIGITDQILNLANYTKGLVLVTGPAGCGKSTTLSCIIDHINETRNNHIITLEDPLEFMHAHKKSIVSQREVSSDSESYLTALRAALRQSPDVILLGEMRDYETINTAITAAETGHLIFSTMHTMGAASTVDRVIDVFPANQQRQITIQLASVLQAIVSQQLVPGVNGQLTPAFEVMTMTPAIRNMIRENKIHQIDGVVYSASTTTNSQQLSMDSSLLQLYHDGKITKDTALSYAVNPDMLSRKI